MIIKIKNNYCYNKPTSLKLLSITFKNDIVIEY